MSKGKIAKPITLLLHGVEGIGKSTFAANAPNPIFIAAEDGTAHLDVSRFPQSETWQDVFDAIEELTTGEHAYKTLVLDTVDWLERLCWDAVCQKPDKNGIRHNSVELYPYGSGWQMELEEWRRLIVALERLRNKRGMHIIMLGHSWIKSFKNPIGEDFDRYELKVHQKSAGLLREWCEDVLFTHYDTFTHKNGSRAKGISNGARVMHTEHRAAWDAKNRHDLPETLPLDWEAYYEAVLAHQPLAPEQLQARIRELLEQADDTLKSKVLAVLEATEPSDAARLARILDRLKGKIALTQQGVTP